MKRRVAFLRSGAAQGRRRRYVPKRRARRVRERPIVERHAVVVGERDAAHARDGRGRVRGERRENRRRRRFLAGKRRRDARDAREIQKFYALRGCDARVEKLSSDCVRSAVRETHSNRALEPAPQPGTGEKRAPRPGAERRRRRGDAAAHRAAAPERPRAARGRAAEKRGESGRQRVCYVIDVAYVKRERCVVWVIEIVQGVPDRANRDQRAPFVCASFGNGDPPLARAALRREIRLEPARAAAGAPGCDLFVLQKQRAV